MNMCMWGVLYPTISDIYIHLNIPFKIEPHEFIVQKEKV